MLYKWVMLGTLCIMSHNSTQSWFQVFAECSLLFYFVEFLDILSIIFFFFVAFDGFVLFYFNLVFLFIRFIISGTNQRTFIG